MRKYINRKSLVVLFFATIVFIYMSNNYDSLFMRSIDNNILMWLHEYTQFFMVYFFEFVTLMGGWQMVILISIILLIIERDKIQVLLIPSITVMSVIINETIKNVIMRPRPNVMALSHASGYSMPSGHSLTAVVFYGLIIIFLVAKIKDKKYRKLINVLLTVLITLIGFSRVYLRVHYFSDVVAGLALGLMIVTVVYNIKVGVFDNITTYLEEENE
ncbi:MAG: phosphatase PAP2 family protein [Erysipelothrix sp.]|nr:phosphatase PAP2 family protein [Erysipelothrix sp.]